MIKVGIFFGGQSREREISFAGGRTVYDNLNKGLFEAIPIFVDSLGNFIHLDWQYVYKGTIRDFYPPVASVPAQLREFQIYVESLGALSRAEQDAVIAQVGRKVQPEEFPALFDFAFLALHGPYGEDGAIQGLLEWYGIPYSGAGLLPTAIGIDKGIQKKLFRNLGVHSPKSSTLTSEQWAAAQPDALFAQAKADFGLPLVVKAARQGSSLGVSIVSDDSLQDFIKAVESAFFIFRIEKSQWTTLERNEKLKRIHGMVDVRQGIGMPVRMDGATIYSPKELMERLDAHFAATDAPAVMQAIDAEEEVLFEEFIRGREFSCIVIQDEEGHPLALPPTGIQKAEEMFDYRSKYLPGMVRKVTPIDLPEQQIRDIQAACCQLFDKVHFNVYARIDGFITEQGEIFLNDPNTTSGMMPSSFFFHQAAEIGLNPSQFLTYIIRTSLKERMREGKRSILVRQKLEQLDGAIASQQAHEQEKVRVAVIFGGYSSERHISVESGRNIYEKLSSSSKYEPVPVFLTGTPEHHELYEVPVNILLKDNADDIREKIQHALHHEKHPVLAETIARAQQITGKYAGAVNFMPTPFTYEQLAEQVKAVFIALHGRPGEDGAVQTHLDRVGLPYNGSGVGSSQTTIDKFLTKEILKAHGFVLAGQLLVQKADWKQSEEAVLDSIEQAFGYPLIAKPSDDGCSSAVMKIKTRTQMRDFMRAIFREQEEVPADLRKALGLKANEEFPLKQVFMAEELVTAKDADHFLEVTGGMLTKWVDGRRVYETFEPSEALASNDILSLEEKFLAGEGQNITPARYALDPKRQQEVSAAVQQTLKQAAEILNVEGYCRIDAFVRIWKDKVETIVIEVNSLPGMTPATCIFHQAAINGYKPYEFIDNILEYGKGKKQQS